MIFSTHDVLDLPFKAGGTYSVSAGQRGALQHEVGHLWSFLHRATRESLSLVFVPDPARDSACPLSKLGEYAPQEEGCTESTLTLHTSGTTGEPKAIRKQLSNCLRNRKAGDSESRWLLTYAPYRWAGMSVILHVMKSQAELCVPAALEPELLIETAREDKATHVSITPSFLRRMVLTLGEEPLVRLPLRQVTFGGEAANQHILDLAARLWPEARITHVYASTELEDVCAVSDRLAGIPASKFGGSEFQFSRDGELLVRGAPTGDLWEKRDDRYYFIGRTQEMINVGGAKVSPIEVERAAESIEGVHQAAAFAEPSPLLGQVVALKYTGTAPSETVRAGLRSLLPKVAWPASLELVDRIELTDAGKTMRLDNIKTDE